MIDSDPGRRSSSGADDRRYIDWAVAQAEKRWPGLDTSVFAFIHGVLTGDLAADGRYDRAAVLRLAMKFQQLTGPVMAKAVEDTARGTGNLMPMIVEAVEADATVGEISDAMRRVYGEYHETVVI